MHKRQLTKLDEDLRTTDTRSRDEAAILNRELARLVGELAQAQAERDQAALERAAAQALADEQRAARMDGMRHHQAELALLTQQHQLELAAANTRCQQMADALAAADTRLQELLKRSARRGLFGWLSRMFFGA